MYTCGMASIRVKWREVSYFKVQHTFQVLNVCKTKKFNIELSSLAFHILFLWFVVLFFDILCHSVMTMLHPQSILVGIDVTPKTRNKLWWRRVLWSKKGINKPLHLSSADYVSPPKNWLFSPRVVGEEQENQYILLIGYIHMYILQRRLSVCVCWNGGVF